MCIKRICPDAPMAGKPVDDSFYFNERYAMWMEKGKEDEYLKVHLLNTSNKSNCDARERSEQKF